MKEIWKFIPFHPTYEISNFGRLKSHKKTIKPIILKGTTNVYGYRQYYIKRKAILAHRLVLIVFKGFPPKNYEACHNDGNPDNNRLDNLRWGTRKENMDDKIKHGTIVYGEACHNSRLNNKKVKEIRMLHKNGMSKRAIAKRCGLAETTVGHAINRRTWKNVL